jgi:hypothetical protein
MLIDVKTLHLPAMHGRLRRTGLPTCVALFLFALSASAGERRFGYSYESSTTPRGQVEFENWATLEHGTREDDGARSVSFKHELEFGLTDRLQLDVYLAEWTWSDPLRSTSETEYDDSAVVLKWNHLDAAREPFGLASYHEIKVGDEFLELENKLILEARRDRITWVHNLTLEAEWKGQDLDERSGEITNSFGVSYESSPRFFFGAEALHEIPLPDWESLGKSNLFAGPNASVRFGGAANWWLTTTALARLGGADDEPEYQLRLIVGFSL